MNNITIPGPVRNYGLLGLAGVAVFITSMIIVHWAGTGIEWLNEFDLCLGHGY